MHDSVGPPESTAQMSCRLVRPFWKASGYVQRTNTETDGYTEHRMSVKIGHILALFCMQCSQTRYSAVKYFIFDYMLLKCSLRTGKYESLKRC